MPKSKKKTKPVDEKSRILSYGKMMEVLGCFNRVERRLSLAEIARQTELPRPTAHRILGALREIGFVEQDGRGSAYGLGMRLFELGSLALANMDLHREARPFVDRLARLAEESVHLGLFNGQEIVVIEREDHGERSSGSLHRTENAPAYCTGLGKAVLAFQQDSVLDRILRNGLTTYTRNTIVTKAGLLREMDRIRKRGFALDNAEHQVGVRCVACPIRNAGGRVIAAISVTGPDTHITDDRVPVLAKLVAQAAAAISMQIGYREGAD